MTFFIFPGEQRDRASVADKGNVPDGKQSQQARRTREYKNRGAATTGW